MAKKDTFTVVVGCGRLGAHIAQTLLGSGGGVLVIDETRDSFRKLGATFDGILLCGDATDTATLDEAGIGSASALIAVTGDDNINIMVAQMAKALYNVPRVIARLYNPERSIINEKLGIGTISPVLLSTKEIESALNIDEVPV
ncbi:MAG: TrkA family potassium uptake protein [Oscillospiraceae bacterium]|jgi:trk system potassium uptake protein TrkA|nr:TrkA family potassium uptake protein [Oscillospiraceae bacterium]